MTESEIIVKDPDYVRKKTTDGSGRLYLGKEFADTEVEVVINILEDEDDE